LLGIFQEQPFQYHNSPKLRLRTEKNHQGFKNLDGLESDNETRSLAAVFTIKKAPNLPGRRFARCANAQLRRRGGLHILKFPMKAVTSKEFIASTLYPGSRVAANMLQKSPFSHPSAPHIEYLSAGEQNVVSMHVFLAHKGH